MKLTNDFKSDSFGLHHQNSSFAEEVKRNRIKEKRDLRKLGLKEAPVTRFRIGGPSVEGECGDEFEIKQNDGAES
jgi:hypothetical protein